jgi:hypothetical protein
VWYETKRKIAKPTKRVTKDPINAEKLESIYQKSNVYWLIARKMKPKGIQIVAGSGFLT